MTRPLKGADFARIVGVGLAVGLALLAPPLATVGAGLVALATANQRKARSLKYLKRDDEGRVVEWTAALRAVQRGGVEAALRAEAWPLLLGVYSSDSTEDERLATLAQLRKLYTKLVLVCQELEREVEAAKAAGQLPAAGAAGSSSSSSSSGGGANGRDVGGGSSSAAAGAQQVAGAAQPPAPPLPGNLAAFAEAHRIIVMDAVRTDFSAAAAAEEQAGGGAGAAGGAQQQGAPAEAGGIFGSPTVTVLPVAVIDGIPEFVFVDHPPSPAADPDTAVPSAGEAASGLAPGLGSGGNGATPLWTSRLASEVLGHAVHVAQRSKMQMLRLVNLLSAYAIHDPETGYCQGMSDLAAVFVQLFDDDAVAFACFERMMRRARRNFKHDETGIRHQLHQVASILQHTDPDLYAQLCKLGAAPDCMFAYRMLIVMCRRELSAENASVLWEVQWALEAAAAAERSAAGAGPQPSGASMGSSGSIHSSSSRQYLAGSAGGSSGSLAAWVEPSAGSSSSGSRSSSRSSSRQGATAPAGREGGGGDGSANGSAPGGGVAEGEGDFLLWFVAAAVRAQARRLHRECEDTDDVLRLFNGAGSKIDGYFWSILDAAERSYRSFAQGRAVMERL